MNKTLDTDKDPIHHYNSEHGIVPPWILFKNIYFSTIINFINNVGCQLNIVVFNQAAGAQDKAI